jgi:uncharacterized protein YjbI with pentapeptide repeats
VLLGAFAFTAIAWIGLTRLLQHYWPWDPRLGHGQAPTSTTDITKIALSVVAGIGAAIALTVAYRRQRDLERGRFDERFAAAAAQLGADTTAQRLAGVYTIGALADENRTRRQQCIDLLCAYLRLPYDPAAGLLRTVISEHSWPVGTATGKEQRTYESPPNDREVRRAIIALMMARLRTEDQAPWRKSSFDFSDVLFDVGDFLGVTFRRWVKFERATFSGQFTFDQANFSRGVSFDDAKFSGQVSFRKARFSGASFEGATFSGEVYLDGVIFRNQVSFDGAKFSGKVYFRWANFRGSVIDARWRVSFRRATFSAGHVSFATAKFGRRIGFGRATLTSGDVRFSEAIFSGGEVEFDYATFCGSGSFGKATFSGGHVSFRSATFLLGQVDFYVATFSDGVVSFQLTKFSGGDVMFENATFSGGQVMFDNATFSGGQVMFDNLTLRNYADSEEARHDLGRPRDCWALAA